MMTPFGPPRGTDRPEHLGVRRLVVHADVAPGGRDEVARPGRLVRARDTRRRRRARRRTGPGRPAAGPPTRRPGRSHVAYGSTRLLYNACAMKRKAREAAPGTPAPHGADEGGPAHARARARARVAPLPRPSAPTACVKCGSAFVDHEPAFVHCRYCGCIARIANRSLARAGRVRAPLRPPRRVLIDAVSSISSGASGTGAIVLLFLGAALESAAFLGFLVPGETIVVARRRPRVVRRARPAGDAASSP